MTSPADIHRSAYASVKAAPTGTFTIERQALFSPAAAAQDESNPTSTISRFGATYLPVAYGDWMDETTAHVESCYLGDWSPLSKARITGPDAHAFLTWLGANRLDPFPVGRIKHHIQLDENGWIASEGVLRRTGEQEYVYTAGSTDWLLWQATHWGGDVTATDISPDVFIFGVQGPRSADVLTSIVEGGLPEIGFNHGTAARIGDAAVDLLRTGISGELGYEIHGATNDADAVWRAIRDAGAAHGLRLLGLRSQPVQHIEAGIATNGLDYMPAAALSPGAPWQFTRGMPGGSYVPSAFTDLFRRPDELGWGARVDTGHDFLGKDALAANPTTRTLVGLVWNADDVLGVFRALFEPGERVEPMELPKTPGPSFDRVLVGDTEVGVSTGREYSANLRQTQSLAVLDHAHAAPGTEVTVIWGRPGTRQLSIRATVTHLPFKADRRREQIG